MVVANCASFRNPGHISLVIEDGYIQTNCSVNVYRNGTVYNLYLFNTVRRDSAKNGYSTEGFQMGTVQYSRISNVIQFTV